MTKSSIFYDKLKKSLDESSSFPSEYFFKFIVPTNKNQLKQVKDSFNIKGAIVNTRSSKAKNYVSISILTIMHSSDAIIEKYREVENIEGIIPL